ncbi:hypothetical protein EDO6_02961 [Paenibacillus xylanexedens]|nr:hypothetical protein EDO6_02961 [Paenibacillus xylanexedens]
MDFNQVWNFEYLVNSCITAPSASTILNKMSCQLKLTPQCLLTLKISLRTSVCNLIMVHIQSKAMHPQIKKSPYSKCRSKKEQL